jgi:hypothetical protein
MTNRVFIYSNYQNSLSKKVWFTIVGSMW